MKITIIGCGAMGSAFAQRWSKLKHQLVLCDHSKEKAEKLAAKTKAQVELNAKRAIKGADLILLAVKPADFSKMARALGPIGKDQIILSILTAVSVADLKKTLKANEVVRLVPNIAVSHGKSVLVLALESTLSTKGKQRLETGLKGLGNMVWLEESKMDAATALAGSGPAFIFSFIEAFVESGILLGLSSKEALSITLQAIEGCVALLEDRKTSPQELRWNITSPAGTTIHGLKVLEEGGMQAVVMEALRAAFLRAKEMQK